MLKGLNDKTYEKRPKSLGLFRPEQAKGSPHEGASRYHEASPHSSLL